MPTVALTDRFCQYAKPKGERTDYFDEDTSGLALRVSEGRKAWTYTFTSPRDGKRARMTLGTYPATSLASARGRALEAAAHVEGGKDPRDVAAAQSASGMTVAALVTSYLEKHVRPSLRTAKAIERRFHKNIVPVIGAMLVAELHRRDVNRAVDPILARGKPIEAARCFEDMRALMRWAVARGDLDHNPIEGMRKPATSTPRERVLSDDEIRTAWNRLPVALAKSVSVQRIVKLGLVTAQRVGEVAGMRRSEIDCVNRLWTIPGSRTKNGHKHVVPLSGMALTVIDEALANIGANVEHLFPDAKGECALPAHAVAKTITRAHVATDDKPMGRFGTAPWTAHDLRRTAVTRMAELGVAPIVLGHVINHRSVTRAGVTLAVYSQYDYAREKREALELWADRLAAIVGAGAATVTPMTRRRA